MITGQMIVDQAQTWIGTPFHHQGRAKGIGVDCIGLVIGIGKELGIFKENEDYSDYGRDPNNGVLFREVSKHFHQIGIDELSEGCILLMRWHREPQHVAIYAGDRLVHSAYQFRGVVAHGFDAKWRKRTMYAFRFPTVMYG